MLPPNSDPETALANEHLFCRETRALSAAIWASVRAGRTAGACMRLQAVDALGIVSMHPVTQGLPVHAVLRRRLATGPAIQNRRKRQESAHLRRVPTPAGNRSK